MCCGGARAIDILRWFLFTCAQIVESILLLKRISTRPPYLGDKFVYLNALWRHQMETFSALMALCAGNSQRPVTRSFDVFVYLRLIKHVSKQSWGWWFEISSRPLWRHCNENPLIFMKYKSKAAYPSHISLVCSVWFSILFLSQTPLTWHAMCNRLWKLELQYVYIITNICIPFTSSQCPFMLIRFNLNLSMDK